MLLSIHIPSILYAKTNCQGCNYLCPVPLWGRALLYFHAYLSHLSQFLDGPGIAQVLVESRGYAQDELWYEEYQHRRDRPYPLDQYSCHGQAYWLTPESNQSKHAIDTPLQMVGNHCEPVAELHGGVNRHDNEGKRCYYA